MGMFVYQWHANCSYIQDGDPSGTVYQIFLIMSTENIRYLTKYFI